MISASKPFSCESVKPTLNDVVFGNFLIMSNIMRHLDLASVKNSRLVAKSWLPLTSKELRVRVYYNCNMLLRPGPRTRLSTQINNQSVHWLRFMVSEPLFCIQVAPIRNLKLTFVTTSNNLGAADDLRLDDLNWLMENVASRVFNLHLHVPTNFPYVGPVLSSFSSLKALSFNRDRPKSELLDALYQFSLGLSPKFITYPNVNLPQVREVNIVSDYRLLGEEDFLHDFLRSFPNCEVLRLESIISYRFFLTLPFFNQLPTLASTLPYLREIQLNGMGYSMCRHENYFWDTLRSLPDHVNAVTVEVILESFIGFQKFIWEKASILRKLQVTFTSVTTSNSSFIGICWPRMPILQHFRFYILGFENPNICIHIIMEKGMKVNCIFPSLITLDLGINPEGHESNLENFLCQFLPYDERCVMPKVTMMKLLVNRLGGLRQNQYRELRRYFARAYNIFQNAVIHCYCDGNKLKANYL